MSTAARRRRSDPPSALYQKVKDFVVGKIHDGSFKPGDRVPSEHDLVAKFGIARMTVNRALRELAEQGRVVRLPGVGTFVAEDKPQATLLHIVNLADEIRHRQHSYRCQIVEVARVPAPLEIAPALEVDTGESIYHSVCVHWEENVPVQLEDRYVNPKVVPDYLKQDFRKITPSEYLIKTIPYDDVEHVVDAVLPTAEQAEYLRMRVTQPCLVLTRRTWTRGVPVTFVRCVHPGTRYRLGSRFRANANGLIG
jgi:GntR family histidine utilization transcriptional repressor